MYVIGKIVTIFVGWIILVALLAFLFGFLEAKWEEKRAKRELEELEYLRRRYEEMNRAPGKTPCPSIHDCSSGSTMYQTDEDSLIDTGGTAW